jgi:hypothetical protein
VVDASVLIKALITADAALAQRAGGRVQLLANAAIP